MILSKTGDERERNRLVVVGQSTLIKHVANALLGPILAGEVVVSPILVDVAVAKWNDPDIGKVKYPLNPKSLYLYFESLLK